MLTSMILLLFAGLILDASPKDMVTDGLGE
jgi:hypothetical protein